ncbi:MAG: hypothetical protein HY820_16055 [Acidobacteria bacterium]|nr:hypothetical protein [Acidobacteriota bacterium]
MTDLVRRFWLRCEETEPLFSADEIRWTPPEQFDLLRGHGLLREAARATWAVCDACGEGHAEEVVWISRGAPGSLTPFIPCPAVGGVPIEPERLRRWAADLDLTALKLRETLGLIGGLSLLFPGRVWSLGRRHLAGRFRDFFLVCGAAREDAHAIWERCRHIVDAPSPVILVPARSPQQKPWPAFRLADITAITEGGLTLDMDYIADAVPRDSYAMPAKTVASFPVGDDARWEDLRITIGEGSIFAELRNEQREFSLDDLQFTGSDDRLWQLLRAFGRFGGETPARSTSVSGKDAATFRKQVSDLRQRLTTVFPIAGEPIRAVHGKGAYRCLFQIGLDRRDGFPVRPERWEDCQLLELRDGRIQISVKSKEVFAARSRDEESQRLTAIDAGERETVRSEEYDLRILGLATEAGIPTAEGAVLLEFLRSGGKIYRRGDDKDVLRFRQRLRAWMGMDSDPLQFIPNRRLWTAKFECATVRRQAEPE